MHLLEEVTLISGLLPTGVVGPQKTVVQEQTRRLEERLHLVPQAQCHKTDREAMVFFSRSGRIKLHYVILK